MRARTLFSRALLISFLLTPLSVRAQGDTPLALLMARQGEVTVLRDGGSMAGEFGMHLDAGDEIRTGPQSSADIVFATGQMLQLGANGSLVVQGARGSADSGPGAGANPTTQVSRLLSLKDQRGTSLIGQVRGEGRSNEILALAPRASHKIRSLHPVFRWTGGEDAGELLFTLEHSGEVFWETTVADVSSLEYPSAAPALQPGESYSWRVQTNDPLALSPAESQTAFFQVLSQDEMQEVQTRVEALNGANISEPTRIVLLASLLYDHGLVDEAIEVMDTALAADDADPNIAVALEGLKATVWP